MAAYAQAGTLVARHHRHGTFGRADDAGSAALAEARRRPVGIARAPSEARAFYTFILIATLAGVAMNFAHIDPIAALLWSAVINGVIVGTRLDHDDADRPQARDHGPIGLAAPPRNPRGSRRPSWSRRSSSCW
jgi:hypothetical protein